MSYKVFLPLTITAFLASAAAATTPSATHFTSPRTANQCAVSMQGTGYVYAPSSDALANTAIGGIYTFQRRFIASSDLFVRRSDGKSFHPYMVAALEMAASPLADGTPTSCYPPLSFATTSVPQAMVGAGYSVSLAANGGQPPYSWSFGQSSLPQGFSISSSGDLTGTPPAAGSYAFNVVVSDSLKSNVTGALTLIVAANNTTPPPTQPPPTQPPPTQPPPTQPPPTQPPPTQPPPTQPPPTQPPPTQPPPTQPPPTQPPPTQPPPTQPPPTQPPPTQPPPTQPPPTQPPPTQPPPTGPVTGTALTACGDLTKGGSYYLANDVSSPGTCFGIDANGITLNLNGHTITYGTGGGLTATPAIEGHDPSWNGSPNYTGTSYSGAQHGALEMYGGTIIQSANAAPFSDVFSFGEGNFTSAPYIHDITATFQNQGAQFYYSAYMPTGAKIENNTIYDNVTNIQFPGQGYLSARSAFQGQAIFISGQENNPVTSGDTISGNKIIGGPQGGIRTVDQYSTITNNDIAQNATYSNDWCVEISADHTTASGNNCHPKSGRGINVDANYVTVTNNAINVTELPQNMEYGSNGQPGCEGGGAYGIRVEYMTLNNSQLGAHTSDTISGNTINVAANACNALGLDLIYLPATASGINITGNTITTTNAGQPSVVDAGFQFDDSWGNGINITDNTITSTDEWMYGFWDAFSGITVGHNTWKGSPPITFFADDGGCTPGSLEIPGASCPVSINITDSLPNNVKCGSFSEATVTIGGQVTQCKPQ